MLDTMDLEIFRAGDYGAKGFWSGEALDRLVRDYDPALHEAPVTVDHAQAGPALGWVTALRRVGDRLFARLKNMNARLVEMIRSGAFKKRSVEIYPELKETGGPYLRAVSFLGAAAPEVKGMADPVLGDDPQTETPGWSAPLFDAHGQKHVDFEEIMEKAAEPMPQEIFNGETSALSPMPEDPHTDSDKDNASEKQTAAARPPALQFNELADQLRAQGKWQPAWESRGIQGFFETIGQLEFALNSAGNEKDATAATPAEWFCKFLASLPPHVTLGETAALPSPGGVTACFAEDQFEPQSIELHRQALRFMETHPGVAYGDALIQCAR